MKEHFSKKDTMIAKGIAIIIMLNYHLFNYENDVLDMAVNYQPFSLDTFMIISGFGNICVAIFVLISSYGISRGLEKLHEESLTWQTMYGQAFRRAGKLMWNFFFMYLSVWLLWHKYFDFTEIYGSSLQGVVAGVMDMFGFRFFSELQSLNHIWWYMELAYLIIFIVPILYVLTKRMGAWIIMPAFFLPLIFDMNYDVERFYLVMVLGVVLGATDVLKKLCRIHVPFWFALPTGAVLIIICAFVRQNPLMKEHFWWIIDGPIALLILWYAKEVLAKIPVVNIVLEFLGKHSMNMYYVHMFFYLAIYRQFIYSFRYAGIILLMLILVSLGYSVALELAKKGVIRGVQFVCGKWKMTRHE